MLPPRRLVFFFLRLVMLYAVLLWPWPGVRQAYAAVFRAGGTLLFSSFGSDGQVQFSPTQTTQGDNDVQLTLRNRRVPDVETRASCNSFYRGYFPTAFVVALVLATPLPWLRRLKALLWGLLAVNAFVAVRLTLFIVELFNGDHAMALYQLSPFWMKVLEETKTNLSDAPASHFVVPLFIWILVTLRRSDLEVWFKSMTPKARAGAKSRARPEGAPRPPPKRRPG